MIRFIFTLTLRQMLGRRSSLIPIGLALLPVFMALIFRLSEPDRSPEEWTVKVLFVGLVITGILPLIALLYGTSVLGDELEEGTAVYLLTRPLRRWQILLPKLVAACLVTSVLVALSIEISGVIALKGQGDLAIVDGFAIAAVIGCIAYTTVFVLLSVINSRALISGLIYVFIWEASVTGIFTGTRYFSIRHYTLGIADWLVDVQPSIFDARIGGLLAFCLVTVVTVVAALYANRRLQEIEVREAT